MRADSFITDIGEMMATNRYDPQNQRIEAGWWLGWLAKVIQS